MILCPKCYYTDSRVVVLMFENTVRLKYVLFLLLLCRSEGWTAYINKCSSALAQTYMTLEGLFLYNWSAIKKSNTVTGTRCVCGYRFLLTMLDTNSVVMTELCKEMNHEKWQNESKTFNDKFKDSEKGLTFHREC